MPQKECAKGGRGGIVAPFPGLAPDSATTQVRKPLPLLFHCFVCVVFRAVFLIPFSFSPAKKTRRSAMTTIKKPVIALRRDIAGAVTVRLQAHAVREPSRHAGAKERVNG